LYNLDDDEGVEDEDGKVGNQLREDQLAPDEVDGHVELEISVRKLYFIFHSINGRISWSVCPTF
jgi:hypothetical protein